jgi:TolA-binding protein
MTSTALCIYAGSVVCAETANADSEETLAGVLTEIESISKELDQIEETKEELNLRLTSDFSSDLKAIDELHAEIADLELSMEEFLEDDEDDEDYSSDDDDSFAQHADDYAGEPLTEQEVEDTKANERLCKKIYLKIAKRCHPDKTRVPRFRSLFIQAGTAMAALMLTLWKRFTSRHTGNTTARRARALLWHKS